MDKKFIIFINNQQKKYRERSQWEENNKYINCYQLVIKDKI